MDLDKLIGQKISITEKVSKEEKKKTVAYLINSYKKEFENEKMNRYNFLLKSQLPCLIDINIKLCTKGKELKDIFAEIVNKTCSAISENSFLKEAILILRQIDKKADLNIVPILHSGKLVYNVSINKEFKGTFYNESMTAKMILNQWGLYDYYKKPIDFFLVAELKKENSKELSKKLFDVNSFVDTNLILEVAKETEDKDKVYPVLKELLSEEELKKNMRFYKYFNYFKYRMKFVNIFKELNKDKMTNYLVMKWFKEELKNPFIVNDPHNFDTLFDIEFKNASEDKKQYINKVQTELKKFWIYFENKMNDVIKEKEFKIALCRVDFLLEQLYIKVISKNEMKDYVIDMNNISKEIDYVSKDFEKEK